MSPVFARAAGSRRGKAATRHARAALLAALAFAAPATFAQGTVGPAGIPNPPDIDLLDDNGVQIDSGYSSFSVADVAIGGLAGLAHVTRNDPSAGSVGTGATVDDRYRFSGFYPETPIVSSFVGGILNSSGPIMGPSGSSFSFQGVSERFAGTLQYGDAPGASLSGDGGSLVNNGNNSWTYVDKQGASYAINADYLLPTTGVLWPVTQVTYPDGSTLKIHFKQSSGGRARIQGVEKSNGFFLKFYYGENGTAATTRAWYQYNRIVAGNKAYEYCDVAADSCSFALQWPESQAYFSNADTRFSIVDSQGRETRFTLNQWFEVVAVKPPTSDSDTITFEMCSRHYPGNCAGINNSGGAYTPWISFLTFPGMVYAATQHGLRRQYGYQAAAGGHVNVVTAADPYRGNSSVMSLYDQYNYPNTGSLQTVILPQLAATYSGNAKNRLLKVVRPGSSREEYVWDSRRNMTRRTLYPKDGDSAAPLVTVIDYDPTCANVVICNKPRFVVDPKLNRTDYVYDPVHGGIRSVTGPAVEVITASGTAMVRPQTRYEYAARTPWLKTTGGGYAAGAAVQMLAKESFCRTSAATGDPAAPCAIAGDQVETVYEYGPDSGPNNLLVRGMAVTADGVTIRTCYAYDRFGNKISETKPLGTGASQCP